MGVLRFVGSFVQTTFFGGSHEDLLFEIRVLKGEVARLHERLDKELDDLRDRLDRAEGKPGKGRGKSRLAVVSAAEAADASHDHGSSSARKLDA